MQRCSRRDHFKYHECRNSNAKTCPQTKPKPIQHARLSASGIRNPDGGYLWRHGCVILKNQYFFVLKKIIIIDWLFFIVWYQTTMTISINAIIYLADIQQISVIWIANFGPLEGSRRAQESKNTSHDEKLLFIMAWAVDYCWMSAVQFVC